MTAARRRTNLFQHKHGVIEQLLQFFIRHVDAKLLKTVLLLLWVGVVLHLCLFVSMREFVCIVIKVFYDTRCEETASARQCHVHHLSIDDETTTTIHHKHHKRCRSKEGRAVK